MKLLKLIISAIIQCWADARHFLLFSPLRKYSSPLGIVFTCFALIIGASITMSATFTEHSAAHAMGSIGNNNQPENDNTICVKSGCNGEICTDNAIVGNAFMSVCIWRPEYSCYKSAICAKDENGECNWKATQQLTNCLDAHQSTNTR